MYRELTNKGIKIPNGFAVTADAYWLVLSSAGILSALKDNMAGLDKTNVADLAKRGRRARDLILGAGIPDELWAEIRTAYDKLCEEYGHDTDVAVRKEFSNCGRPANGVICWSAGDLSEHTWIPEPERGL